MIRLKGRIPMSKIHKNLHNMMTKQDRIARRNKPPYPRTKRVNIFDSLKSRDFRLSLYYFGMFQLAIILLTYSALNDNNQLSFFLSMIVAVGISIQGYMESRVRQGVKFNMKSPNIFKILLYIVLLFSSIYAVGIFANIYNWNIPVQENQEALNQLLKTHFYPMAFITTIVAPIVEELVFRELLPHAFGPSYVSFIISTILFGILHSPAGLVGYLSYGILSTLFIYIRLKNNNLLTAIYVHIGYNFSTILMSLLLNTI